MATKSGEHGSQGEDAVRELGRKLRERELVHAIVGAGLSASMNLPDWETLLDGIDPAPKPTNGELNVGNAPMLDERSQRDLPWRAQLIERNSDDGRARLRRRLTELFMLPQVTPSAALNSVVRLPFAHILTTNYDNLLDLTHPLVGNRDTPRVLRWEMAAERAQFINQLGRKSDQRLYLHLHGRADSPEGCVITEEDYRERYVRSHTLSRNLYALFASQTVVFIGFSLMDRDFTEILREVQALGGSSPRHYAILPKPKDGEAGLTSYLLGKYGVMPILYPNESGRHEGLALLLADLETCVASESDWAHVDLSARRSDGEPDARNDPNAGRFGGEATRLGYQLTASNVQNWDGGWVTLTLEVKRTDAEPMQDPVALYLHPSFPESMVRLIPDRGRTAKKLIAWGAFTVGAVVGKQRILLELDLAKDERLSKIFRAR